MSAKLINKWKLFKKIIDSTRQKYARRLYNGAPKQPISCKYDQPNFFAIPYSTILRELAATFTKLSQH